MKDVNLVILFMMVDAVPLHTLIIIHILVSVILLVLLPKRAILMGSFIKRILLVVVVVPRQVEVVVLPHHQVGVAAPHRVGVMHRETSLFLLEVIKDAVISL